MSSVAKDLHLCVPVIRRYDLLRELMLSLRWSTVKPHTVHIIDNGRSPEKLVAALYGMELPTDIFIPDKSMGVAESWNWFILHVPEERLIVSDDITFSWRSLQLLLETPGDCVTATRGHAFSCFLLRDSCIERVGLFDDTISPGYAYFEDLDYEERMTQLGIPIIHVDDSGVSHARSATLASFSEQE